MKHKILFIFTLALILSTHVVAQDSTTQRPVLNDETYPINTTRNNYNSSLHQIYRDTRLGSSSANYNTYKKNDNGAGAITTNPHKASGTTFFPETQPDTNAVHAQIYRDTRLGSSSSSSNTYQKNDDGAGAVTTNPHK